jgi:cytidylate kinase
VSEAGSLNLIITIDGPAGTGKSTVAHQLARRLSLEFLDTGAMYRAATLISIEQGIDPSNGRQLALAVEMAHMEFDWHKSPPALLLGQRDISQRIREMDVSQIVSAVAAQPEVRHVLVTQQRRIAGQHPRLVTEGRDQGSVVFPDAPIRFYIDAQPEVRAQRREAQLAKAGKAVDRERVWRDITERDRLDAQRAEGPLVRPVGAIEIDTTDRSLAQVVDELEAIVRRQLSEAGISL